MARKLKCKASCGFFVDVCYNPAASWLRGSWWVTIACSCRPTVCCWAGTQNKPSLVGGWRGDRAWRVLSNEHSVLKHTHFDPSSTHHERVGTPPPCPISSFFQPPAVKDNRPNLEIPDPPGLLSAREDLEPDQTGCKFHFCDVVGIGRGENLHNKPIKTNSFWFESLNVEKKGVQWLSCLSAID